MAFENSCKHFNGTGSVKCEAGVLYADVKNNEGSFGERNVWPCFKDTKCPNQCEHRQWPTQTEIDEYNAEIDAAMNAVRTVRPKIKEHIKKQNMEGRNVSGFIQCPVCEDGEVAYSCAGAYNGHISAKCSNGCVNWIE